MLKSGFLFGDTMNEVDDEGYKYLGVLQDAVLKNREIKEKIGKGWVGKNT